MSTTQGKRRINWTAKEWESFLAAAAAIDKEEGDTEKVWGQAQIQTLPIERRRSKDPHAMALMNSYRKGGRDAVVARLRKTPQGMPLEIQKVLFGEAQPDRRGSGLGRARAPSAPVILRPATPAPAETVAPAAASTAPAPARNPPSLETLMASAAARGIVEPSFDLPAMPDPAIMRTDPVDMVANTISDVILRVLYNPAIRQALRNFVTEAIAPEAELAQIRAVTWRNPLPTQERSPRIVVVGGWQHLLGALKTMKGVDFRFWGRGAGDENLHRLRAICKGCDLAVIITNNTGHPAEQMARANAPEVVRWARNAEELKAHIEQWLAQRKEAA